MSKRYDDDEYTSIYDDDSLEDEKDLEEDFDDEDEDLDDEDFLDPYDAPDVSDFDDDEYDLEDEDEEEDILGEGFYYDDESSNDNF